MDKTRIIMPKTEDFMQELQDQMMETKYQMNQKKITELWKISGTYTQKQFSIPQEDFHLS